MSSKPGPACQRERDDLVQCILRTDCVLKQNKSPKECLQAKTELPIQCQQLLATYTDCRRGLLDMRRRFRGNHLTDEAKRGGVYESSLDAARGDKEASAPESEQK
ncbi:hypothetical protein VHUM_02495 [Vanrija humicola]|uniref:Cytochrome c oxidase assembly factor 5 n=1 Tax=Vanrija humicola TaxID=5417 RepID=A0A7D8YVV6_VANHU|nr:hypothetical protein VHUM_02495 [Vanrija humicola]